MRVSGGAPGWHYRRVIVMERVLLGDLPLPASRLAVRVAQLLAEDLPRLVMLRREPGAAVLERRLARGHRCFAAWHEDRIVHAGWAAPHAAWIDFLEWEIPLGAGDVYQYDSFTAPDVRGLGVAALRVAWMARHFQAEGARRLLAVVWPGNPGAFRPLERVGYRRRGSIRAFRLGPWRRVIHGRSLSRQ
ncbi:MAG TPA: GNAT family protein [Methylomirabilota bacterium]|nr:GNAT family protein [Methylomirabilota bacterium]